jgi:hypothetical protein
MNAHTEFDLARRLNASCFCMTLDRAMLLRELKASVPAGLAWAELEMTHPHLFAAVPSFVSIENMHCMVAVVSAVERVALLPSYQKITLDGADPVTAVDHGQLGVMMGYDFHITEQGPKLIEINTNAGGAVLNAVLRNAQKACCPDIEHFFRNPDTSQFAIKVANMFKQEWHCQFPNKPLQTIAIVDNAPEQQYLYPEFVLVQSLLTGAGVTTIICDPSELTFDGKRLHAKGIAIDLVYNRLVDFLLADKAAAALRLAYVAGAIALTPTPRHHALLANKGNLVILSDAGRLAALGVTEEDIQTLGAIPKTILLSEQNADTLWRDRRNHFFKPLGGHGGKAVYRGEKLTLGTWSQIIAKNYVAQELVLPGTRNVEAQTENGLKKMDVRLYTYDGRVLLLASRLYQGQTTNFRTPGGGFSPVFVI